MPRGIGVCRRRRGRAAAILNEEQDQHGGAGGGAGDGKAQQEKSAQPDQNTTASQTPLPSQPFFLPNTGYNLFVVQTFLRTKRFFPAWYHNELLANLSNLYCPFNWTLMSSSAHAELRQAAIDVEKAVLQHGRILVAELKDDDTLALKDIGGGSANVDNNNNNMVLIEDLTLVDDPERKLIKTEPREQEEDQIVFPLDFPLDELIQIQDQDQDGQQEEHQQQIKKEQLSSQ